ncbi:MAG: helix-hairpin-helix domain-containing protein [Gammaproteobacteria bacterium]|nr:helix-hairpin-helix domain-containing protein [Gammaproteobacteria bacterium]MDH5215630.1 helix-hairpin-helix domain-containing protein [Gammaproteobacteria bacterium]
MRRQKMADSVSNERIAEIFRDCAGILRQQFANPFRVNAYLRAAQTVEALQTDVQCIAREHGVEGLMQLPFIGRGLASAIEEIVRTGHLSQLDRLRGTTDPEELFRAIPGVGPALAHAIHQALHVDTLEALEIAAHDGRLARVPGIGPRRADAIRSGLASILGPGAAARNHEQASPGVELLLGVDREYRQKAESGSLPKIAPRRFNPKGERWLPVLHTRRAGWHFTALYSNTARSHELRRTRDWVVLYFYDGDHKEGQATVVTETHGPLQGKRVVRGREAECLRLAGRDSAA